MTRRTWAIGSFGPSHPKGIVQVLARCCCRCGPYTLKDAELLADGAMRTDGFCPECEAAFDEELDNETARGRGEPSTGPGAQGATSEAIPTPNDTTEAA